MRKMLWAEWRKLRRSSIILLTVFATVLIAVIVLVAGRETTVDGFYLSDAGWYMTMVQPWATMFCSACHRCNARKLYDLPGGTRRHLEIIVADPRE